MEDGLDGSSAGPTSPAKGQGAGYDDLQKNVQVPPICPKCVCVGGWVGVRERERERERESMCVCVCAQKTTHTHTRERGREKWRGGSQREGKMERESVCRRVREKEQKT